MSEARTAEQLLDTWRRSLDESYTRPIEEDDDGRSFDVIAAQAAMWERVGEATERTSSAVYVKEHSTQLEPPGTGSIHATGQVTFMRMPPTLGDINLLMGDRMQVLVPGPDGLVNGPVIELTADVTLPEGTNGPIAGDVRAVRAGFQGNAPAGRPVRFVERGSASLVAATSGEFGGNVFVYTETPPADGDALTLNMGGQFVIITSGPNESVAPRRMSGLAIAAGPGVSAFVDGPAFPPGVVLGDAEVVSSPAALGVLVELTTGLTGGSHPWLDASGRERAIGRVSGEADPAYRRRVCELPDVVSPNAIIRALTASLSPDGIVFRFVELRTPEGRGFAWNEDAYSDPGAYRNGLWWSGPASSVAYTTIGFVVVIDGTTLPADEAPVINAIINTVNAIKAGGVPWAIAFEPPIP